MSLTKEYKHCFFPFEEWNPVQEKCVSFFCEDSNLVLSASVASGKTAVCEAIMGYELSKGNKVVYICPLNSLLQEKFEDWKKHPTFSNFPFYIFSGESSENSCSIDEAKIILSTVESFDIQCRKNDVWLSSVSVVAFDEAHLFDVEGRGASAEAMLINFSEINNNARLVCLSGTMKNTIELAKWLKSLNGKKTNFINSEWRPNKINKEVETAKNFSIQNKIVLNKIKKFPFDKTLIFVHSKITGENLVDYLREKKIEATFFSSELNKEKKKAIIDSFRDEYSNLKVLVSTSALSMGVSL